MRLVRRLSHVVLVAGIGGGCASDAPLVQPIDTLEASFIVTSTSPVPLTPLAQLAIPTYEGSGQAVHPDVIRFAKPWHGWEYWMTVTPFPAGREAFENPSMLVSHDGLRWQAPAGLVNPIARTPGKNGYNSDPDLTFDAAGDRLLLLYREVSATDNLVRSTTSADGVHWTRPVLVFQRTNHRMVSPTMTLDKGGTPRLWYVDAGPKNCGERVTNVAMQTAGSVAAFSPASPEKGWSTARHKVLVQAGMNIWHLDVTWVPERSEYWAVYVAYPVHHCSGQDLYFARSSDGVTWTTYSIPFLRREESTWTASTLYRASVMYDASRDVIQFFVSGSAADKSWHLGYVDYQLRPFLASLESGFPVTIPNTAHAVATAVPLEP